MVPICCSISCRCNSSQQSLLYIYQTTGLFFRPSCIDTICLIYPCIMSVIVTVLWLLVSYRYRRLSTLSLQFFSTITIIYPSITLLFSNNWYRHNMLYSCLHIIIYTSYLIVATYFNHGYLASCVVILSVFFYLINGYLASCVVILSISLHRVAATSLNHHNVCLFATYRNHLLKHLCSVTCRIYPSITFLSLICSHRYNLSQHLCLTSYHSYASYLVAAIS